MHLSLTKRAFSHAQTLIRQEKVLNFVKCFKLFHDENLQQTNTRRKLPQHNKVHNDKPILTPYSIMATESFCLKIGSKARIPILTTSI
jgi:hypothetical protein